MALSIKQVRYFVAAADAGQVSQAAVELNVSQSAVTAAVLQLEDELGVKLFLRQPSGVSLTAEGARFLHHARNIMSAVNAATHAPLSEEVDAVGTVRVGVSYTVVGYFIPRHLTRFIRSYPRIRLELHELPRGEIEEGLRNGSLDLTVMQVSNLEDRDRIDHETLIRSRRRLWLPVGHPLLATPSVSLADVAKEPYVMLTVDEARNTSDRYWRTHRFRPRIIFETSSVEAVRSLVAEGVGVTMLSDMVYRPWSLEGQRIEQRDVLADIPTMDVGTAWCRDRPLTPPAKILRDFMRLTFGTGRS